MVSEERGLRAELLRQVAWVEPVEPVAMGPLVALAVLAPMVATVEQVPMAMQDWIRQPLIRPQMVSMEILVIRVLMAQV